MSPKLMKPTAGAKKAAATAAFMKPRRQPPPKKKPNGMKEVEWDTILVRQKFAMVEHQGQHIRMKETLAAARQVKVIAPCRHHHGARELDEHKIRESGMKRITIILHPHKTPTSLSRSRFSPKYANSCPLGGFNPNATGLFSPISEDPYPGMVYLNRSYDVGVNMQGGGLQRGLLQYGGETNMFDDMPPGADDMPLHSACSVPIYDSCRCVCIDGCQHLHERHNQQRK
jgi:hypothetical protein